MSGEQKAGESKVQIPQLTPAGKEALAKGKTTRLISSGVSPPRFTLRQRGYWPDEQAAEAGDALHRARTSGVLGQVKEHGEKRKEVTPFIKAIGRRNKPIGARMGVKKGKETIPAFLAERIKQLSKDPISDLTKTSLGAESQRKATGIKGDKPRKKNPQSAGKRRKKRRKTKRKRRKKTKKSRRRRKKRTRRRKK